MCGIGGVVDPRRARRERETARVLGRMADAMVHRGPDAEGHWVDPDAGVGLTHRRLSIIDLSDAGAQPMCSADGRWVLTYNGEVYDHRALAAEMRAEGVVFRGHSDTEVLLEAIARWGLERTLERVDGMFALALWDRQRRRLLLARDRFGEKPLCYGTLGSGEFVFASTLDALRRHPDFDRPVDRDALAMYFRYKYVPAPWSIYSGIRKLEPGCIAEVDDRGRVVATRRYWSHFDVLERSGTFRGSEQDAVDELDRLLRRSVSKRLVADVPVGAFLSGGLDSSTIVSIAGEERGGRLRTFTIGSGSRDLDESVFAREVAAHLGTDHTELVANEEHVLGSVHGLGALHDEPFGDSSQVPTRLVSELAARDARVVLSGDGGDELFGGYNRYVWLPRLWGRLGRAPHTVRTALATAGRRVPPSAWARVGSVVPESRRPRQLPLKVAKVLAVADAPHPEEAFHRLVSHWLHPALLVQGATEPVTMHSEPGRWPRIAGLARRMMAVDSVTYLPDDILTKVDRATMSVSLEGRIPFLDRDVAEFAATLPLDFMIRDGRSKWLVRKVLERRLPARLIERPKAGFGIPLGDWLRGDLAEWCDELVHSEQVAAFLDRSMVLDAWAEHRAGRRDRAHELWDVLMFVLWSRHRGITG